jgi:RPA family protein
MAFTNDPTTIIGKVRMYAGDADTDSHILTDEQVTVCINDAAGQFMVAAYLVVMAKIALLCANPNSQSWSTYSQSTDLNALNKLAERLKKDCEDRGLNIDGTSIGQFGRAEIARDKHTWEAVENNKAARGESY